MLLRRLLLHSLFVLVMLPVAAQHQQNYESLTTWFARWRAKSLLSTLDSAYIAIPVNPWQAEVRISSSHLTHFLHIPNILDQGGGYLSFNSPAYLCASTGVYYRGWGLSVSKALTSSNDSEFIFTSYGDALGVDVAYEYRDDVNVSMLLDSRSPLVLPEWFPYQLESLSDGNVALYSFEVNTYYVFNNQRFSYASALSQTSWQMRSAGSFMAGVSYLLSSLDMSQSASSKLFLADNLNIKSNRLAIGGGYGYNWVSSSKRVLLHASLMPMVSFSVYSSVRMTPLAGTLGNQWNDEMQQFYNGCREGMNDYSFSLNPSLMCIARLAGYWNATPHWTTGLTFLATASSSLRGESITANSACYIAKLYVGYKF